MTQNPIESKTEILVVTYNTYFRILHNSICAMEKFHLYYYFVVQLQK